MEWTKKEKKALLEALYENGSTDINYLASALPCKTLAQIKQFVRTYKLKAKDMIENRTNIPEKKLEHWRTYMKIRALRTPKRYEYREHLLSRIFKYIDYFEKGTNERKNKNANVSICYEYLYSMLKGEVPQEISGDCQKFIFKNFQKLMSESESKHVDLEVICSHSKRESENMLSLNAGINCFNIPSNMLKYE